MARKQVKDGVLRGCPTCGTPVEDADLKMRDFRWVNEALPGKVGGMDIDFVVSQLKTKRVLHLELKPPGAPVSMGARMTFAVYVQLGLDAWAVWGPHDDGTVTRMRFNATGQLFDKQTMTQDELAESIASWWAAGEA